MGETLEKSMGYKLSLCDSEDFLELIFFPCYFELGSDLLDLTLQLDHFLFTDRKKGYAFGPDLDLVPEGFAFFLHR